MISKLRGKMKRICLLLAKPFALLGIPPNIVSLFAIPLALVYAFFALRGNFFAALVFAALSASMDLIDGSVAELLKKRTLFGNYFETMIDKAIDFILLGVWVLSFPLAAMLAVGFSFLSSYAKPRAALVIIIDNRDWPAIGEHADKLLILLVGLLVSVFSPKLLGFSVIESALYLIALVSAIGTIQRIAFAKKLIAKAEKNGTILPYLKEKRNS